MCRTKSGTLTCDLLEIIITRLEAMGHWIVFLADLWPLLLDKSAFVLYSFLQIYVTISISFWPEARQVWLIYWCGCVTCQKNREHGKTKAKFLYRNQVQKLDYWINYLFVLFRNVNNNISSYSRTTCTDCATIWEKDAKDWRKIPQCWPFVRRIDFDLIYRLIFIDFLLNEFDV